MSLSADLISQFVKVTNDQTETKTEETLNGTIVVQNGKQYVRLDGSDLLTPVSSTAEADDGERVTVLISDHKATVNGNASSPAASSKTVAALGSTISEFETIIADKVSTKELEAEKARIDTLVADNVTVKERLTASEADIDNLEADNVTINETLTAQAAEIETLDVTKLSADDADIKYAAIADLTAANAQINNLSANYADFVRATADSFTAVEASIGDLEANKLNATDADLKYANIDFSNIGTAAIQYFYATSGLIKNVVVGDGTITGELVGVTIKGDLIEGNTVVAEKLVIKGKDGLYYKLNTDGVTTEAEQTEYNSINGSVILAQSITASKIAVDDLVAFDATIGGFNISDSSLYSGAKSSVDNTTRGIYLDTDGQLSVGDTNNYLRYYKDEDGTYKLDISAESIRFGVSGKSVEEGFADIQDDLNTAIGDWNTETNTGSGLTAQINTLATSMDDLLAKIRKWLTFDDDGLTIGSREVNSLRLVLDNDKVQFLNSSGVAIGYWSMTDGYLYTGNLYVEAEKEARFGDFAFLPRSDGSLTFSKVG